MFDIDGTLTATERVDTECYLQAMSEHLGVAIDSDWSRYRHVTDSGIAAELFELHGRAAEEVSVVRRRFVELVQQALRSRPESCQQVTGASDFLLRVRRSEGWLAGLATGGWGASAKAKLRRAGVDFAGLPFASADDAVSRIEIMKTCLRRATAARAAGDVIEVVYVGDGAWDVRASRDLGWRFIGIGETIRSIRDRARDTYPVFTDFRDADAVLSAAVAG
jgi:phosphoglycolate phosphatase-like HAD superfamily hydrolase